MTSKDFLNWSEPKAMNYGGTPREHLYTNQTQPYFRAPHIYLSIAARFMPGRRILSPAQAKAIDVDPGYFSDCSDAVLMSTRGGTLYTRTFMDAFITVERYLLHKQGLFPHLLHRGPLGFELDEVTRQQVDQLFERLQRALET